MSSWLKFFRVVNLPTVPGDVFVGASAMLFSFGAVGVAAIRSIAIAAIASIFLYMFGLADNDIVGAAKDGSERPIPSGEISLTVARLARGFCLFVVLIMGAVFNLPYAWWLASFLLAVSIVVYNRTKWSLVMGLCRALNVVCGAAVLFCGSVSYVALGVALLWLVYIAVVTRISEGEELDPTKRRLVGSLIGALVYLQLAALLTFYLLTPVILARNLLLVGAALLILLRIMKRALPKVSAS